MNLWIKEVFVFALIALYIKLMFFNFFITVKYSKNFFFIFIYESVLQLIAEYYNVTILKYMKIQNTHDS